MIKDLVYMYYSVHNDPGQMQLAINHRVNTYLSKPKGNQHIVIDNITPNIWITLASLNNFLIWLDRLDKIQLHGFTMFYLLILLIMATLDYALLYYF